MYVTTSATSASSCVVRYDASNADNDK